MKTMVKNTEKVQKHDGDLYYSTPLANLRAGEFFVLKSASILPSGDVKNENAVWVAGDYDRIARRYSCTKYVDFCHEKLMAGDKVVYFGFTF